jgi:sortase A
LVSARASTPETTPVADDRPRIRRLRRRRLVRFLGTTLVVLGVGAVAWTIVVWRWQDPFTALYTMYQQHQLSGQYKKVARAYEPLVAVRARDQGAPTLDVAAERRLVARDAKRYKGTLEPGEALGRIKVPQLGLNAVLVAGTDNDSLKKGPGWYRGSYLPGAGQLMYIAGHRTTYLAPFAQIDSMRAGDLVTIEVPYGTFVYRVVKHVIVPSNDIARLQSTNRPAGTPPDEVVALQACHPRFFASQRYIVYAVPARVSPKGGKPYTAQGIKAS